MKNLIKNHPEVANNLKPNQALLIDKNQLIFRTSPLFEYKINDSLYDFEECILISTNSVIYVRSKDQLVTKEADYYVLIGPGKKFTIDEINSFINLNKDIPNPESLFDVVYKTQVDSFKPLELDIIGSYNLYSSSSYLQPVINHGSLVYEPSSIVKFNVIKYIISIAKLHGLNIDQSNTFRENEFELKYNGFTIGTLNSNRYSSNINHSSYITTCHMLESENLKRILTNLVIDLKTKLYNDTNAYSISDLHEAVFDLYEDREYEIKQMNSEQLYNAILDSFDKKYESAYCFDNFLDDYNKGLFNDEN